MPVAETPNLGLQEKVLAAAMVHNIGDATLRYTLGSDGTRYHDNPTISTAEFDQLVNDFRHDPKDSLAWSRESLMAINRDPHLSNDQKDRRLDRYLDAYFGLTLKLDHAAFPAEHTPEVRKGVPSYIPDGFVDMGGESSLDPAYRKREQLVVDKLAVLNKYKSSLKELFSADFTGVSLDKKKRWMVEKIAMDIYTSIPIDYSLAKKDGALNDGDKVNLSEVNEGLCRHQALAFQVLLQAAGIQSRLLKADMDGVRHSTNMVRLDGKWYIFDVTRPDHVVNETGQKVWKPGVYAVDGPPPVGGKKEYKVKARYSGEEHEYVAHDDMYWHISR